MSEAGGNAGGHIRAFVERIEHLEGEVADLNADKSDVFKEAKSMGFDVPALREVIKIRRARGKDPAGFEERQVIVDLYMASLVHPHAREGAE